MKFSLKSIASAVVLAVAASAANAAIDTGATGNGGLFLNVWDANGSYTFNLNTTIDAFQTNVAAAGNINNTYALNGFSTFLAGVVDASALKFNLLATDTSGARRLLTTYAAAAPAATPSDKLRTAAGNITTFVGLVNTAGTNVSDFIAVGSSSGAFAGKAAMGNRIGGNLNFDTFGNLTNNSYANGLSFMRIDALATGTIASTYTPYADNASAVKVWINGNDLHIAAAAVPEPESYAMLLAGLGMIGFMARRRNAR